jgi:hypothetical protein
MRVSSDWKALYDSATVQSLSSEIFFVLKIAIPLGPILPPGFEYFGISHATIRSKQIKDFDLPSQQAL